MYDYHTHSHFSDDSSTPMDRMAEAAASLGLSEIVVTDHIDPDYPLPDWSSEMDFASYSKEVDETAAKYKGRVTVKKGIEIGIQHGKTLEKCSAASRGADFDFILGSFHCAEGFELSCGDFFANRTVSEAIAAFYRYNIACLSFYEDFDVLGHINVIDRYTDFLPSPVLHADLQEKLLSLLIEKGKGIEINTSSFRYGMGDHTTPTEEILRIYRRLGGEIITVGSDAHRPDHVGHALPWAYDKLRDLGYRYVTTFEKRKPLFVRL